MGGEGTNVGSGYSFFFHLEVVGAEGLLFHFLTGSSSLWIWWYLSRALRARHFSYYS